MTREKFDRKLNYKKISEIGRDNINENSNIVSYTFDWIIQNREEYKQQLLQSLIEQYGEEEGKRQFEIMQLEAEERSKAIENIDMDNVDKYVYKIVKTLMVFILFFNIYIVQFIPLVIFDIPIQNIGGEMNVILTSFSSAVLLLILFLIYRKELVSEWEIFKKIL